ncbi:MAG: anhydro-N-acetylmuramic acid kinase [Alphaproteobacteria bacterium]|nr:anhydro-N-acetylmuramic acid kinase [Alphaproteobacteria bacterium]
MRKKKVYRSIGLMSGTSLDGVDAALIETDGHGYVRPLAFHTLPYDEPTRKGIRACLGLRERTHPQVLEAERILTQAHIEAVKALGTQADVIGFHGQTIRHDPENRFTLQIGDVALLAGETGMDVVYDFRSRDVEAGGQGAPLLPLYHRARALLDEIPLPTAILNIGGVANISWIGPDSLWAFDTGPGNALMDDFIAARDGVPYDADGALAGAGKVCEPLVTLWLTHPYFGRPTPKSLDRDAWAVFGVQDLSTADGLATLAAFTVESIKKGLELLPSRPQAVFVTGGGRRNGFVMKALARSLALPVQPVEALGWNGDALEAEGFAYLAVRSILGEALSLPETTGVPHPQAGGRLCRAE